jgi:hypothetical protein
MRLFVIGSEGRMWMGATATNCAPKVAHIRPVLGVRVEEVVLLVLGEQGIESAALGGSPSPRVDDLVRVGRGQQLVEGAGVVVDGQPQLLQVVGALQAVGRLTNLLDGEEEQAAFVFCALVAWISAGRGASPKSRVVLFCAQDQEFAEASLADFTKSRGVPVAP